MECGKQLLLSFAPILSHGREDAQIIVCCIVRGINHQKVLQSHACLRVVFLLKINIGQQFFGARVPRLKRQRRLKFTNGLIGPVEAEVAQRQIEMSLGVQRFTFEGPLELPRGFGIMAGSLLVQA